MALKGHCVVPPRGSIMVISRLENEAGTASNINRIGRETHVQEPSRDYRISQTFKETPNNG